MLIADETNADTLRRKLARRRCRMDTLREMLGSHAGTVGECDGCHLDRLPLYDDPDEPLAGWQFCANCIRTEQGKIARHIQLIQRRLRELNEPEERPALSFGEHLSEEYAREEDRNRRKGR